MDPEGGRSYESEANRPGVSGLAGWMDGGVSGSVCCGDATESCALGADVTESGSVEAIRLNRDPGTDGRS